jgi:hypothetical protein|tara:strand:+ start:1220 stop:1366 length:147 start_codon:yes stop_codon:yes gene_type:complete
MNDDKELAYKVEDKYNVYMMTRSKTLAERTYNYLKLEYQTEKQNASKV